LAGPGVGEQISFQVGETFRDVLCGRLKPLDKSTERVRAWKLRPFAFAKPAESRRSINDPPDNTNLSSHQPAPHIQVGDSVQIPVAPL
jgi:hypothetical protein